MKNFFLIGLLLGAPIAAQAGGEWGQGPSLVITSATSNNTNYITNQIWPTYIGAAVGTNAAVVIATNFTPINISSYKNVALSFTVQGTAAASVGTATWTIYEAVNQSGNTPTNAAGTGLLYDTLGTVTNTCSGVANNTVVAVYTQLPKPVAIPYQSQDHGIAGLTTLYIGQVSCATNASITNYSVSAFGN